MPENMAEEVLHTDDERPISQTAQDYINAQRRLEIEAREVLPYSFDKCTKPLGPLRQLVFACVACTPVGKSPAGICYSCSISCHGSHGDLIELFSKRAFTCDCGTASFSQTPCVLRDIHNEPVNSSNTYNQNFHNLFCNGEAYVAQDEEGTMYQCFLGDACGEDWFHEKCIISPHAPNAPSSNNKNTPSPAAEQQQEAEDDAVPTGFPDEDMFEHLICWKCVSKNPWLLDYIGSKGVLDPLIQEEHDYKVSDASPRSEATSKKRKASLAWESEETIEQAPKAGKQQYLYSTSHVISADTTGMIVEDSGCQLPRKSSYLTTKRVSLLLREDFRDYICKCASCLGNLRRFPWLLDEDEEIYQPPLDSDAADSSVHESLLDAGEKALATVDRVRAIEGVMAYNILKEKVTKFLQPFAEGNRVVSAEDVKRYFEDLRSNSS